MSVCHGRLLSEYLAYTKQDAVVLQLPCDRFQQDSATQQTVTDGYSPCESARRSEHLHRLSEAIVSSFCWMKPRMQRALAEWRRQFQKEQKHEKEQQLKRGPQNFNSKREK